jgi:hypothetical protein
MFEKSGQIIPVGSIQQGNAEHNQTIPSEWQYIEHAFVDSGTAQALEHQKQQIKYQKIDENAFKPMQPLRRQPTER